MTADFISLCFVFYSRIMYIVQRTLYNVHYSLYSVKSVYPVYMSHVQV